MTRLRVLAVAHNAVLKENQNRWSQLVRRHDVDLCLLMPDEWVEAQGRVSAEVRSADLYQVVIRRPWLSARHYTHFYPQLGRLVRQFRPDLVDVFEEPWSVVALQATVAARRAGARVVVETEQNIYKTLPPPFEQIWRHVLTTANRVVARSVAAANVALAKGGREVSIVPHGVDLSVFFPTTPSPPQRDRRLNVLFVGRPSLAEKGIDTLVRAANILGADVGLTIVGPDLPGWLKVGLSPTGCQVTHSGAVQHERLPDIYRSAHVVVVPSRTGRSWMEQFGRVAIEAMACGIPLVVSDSGALPEVVGDAGLVVEEGSESAIVHALRRLHTDPSLWRRIRTAGLRRVAAKYSWPRVADDLFTVYLASLNGAK